VIIVQDLINKPHKYVVSMNLWEIKHLIDIQPRNAIWIKSSCEPFNEDMNLDEERKKNWLKLYNIEQFNIHASGHASGKQIHEMIKNINPERVIPIHTEHPELYRK
jgi:ribonuclease J